MHQHLAEIDRAFISLGFIIQKNAIFENNVVMLILSSDFEV
jgi:hypothetical protein